ncbi:MAG: hypothetical protein ACLPSH_11675 [Vulcanimicrobiaceae bacterium]
MAIFVDHLIALLVLAAYLFVVLLALSLWSLIRLVVSLMRRKWLLAVASAVLPIVAAFLALESLWYIQLLDGIARFTIERPYYDSQVAELPRNGHRFAEFNWGGMSFASDGVVYDETDEVGLPSGRQSAAWFDRMKNTDLTCGENARLGPVHALGGHYYLASFGC